MRRFVYLWGVLFLLALPALACGSNAAQITPTPTKTPRLIRTVEPITTAAPVEAMLPTSTVTPEPPPTDTPTPEPSPTHTPQPEPPTDTPTPEPPPTATSPPPPPPTNTPPPPPPTNTPPPPPPAEPTVAPGPQIIIELPDGDRYGEGDEVRVIITVRDSDGVSRFEWGVFTENDVSVKSGDKNCGNNTECRVEVEFEAVLIGAFQIGVKAKDSKGLETIELKQIYVG